MTEESLSRSALADAIRQALPDHRIVEVRVFGVDDGSDGDETEKAGGYGRPRLVRVEGPDGSQRKLVFHVAAHNAFGHDRRSDRAAAQLLAFDTYCTIPRHCRALDVGAFREGGRVVSLGHAGELYLLTEYVEGVPYAQDLRRIASDDAFEPLDVSRARRLGQYLAELHAEPIDNPTAYARSVRDVIGHGEGIFGIVDAFPEGTEGAALDRVRRLEAACVEYRWKLRVRRERLRRVHGDFHPFNILFSEGTTELSLLDASQGCLGDPAMDLTALAVNYLFFGMSEEGRWMDACAELWDEFWGTYLEITGDREVLEAAPLFFTFRALVLASPVWYPNARPALRRMLLDLSEQFLTEGRLDLDAPRRWTA